MRRIAASPARTEVCSCCWRIAPTNRFFSFSSSSAGNAGIRRTSTRASISRSASRERAPAEMSTPTGSDASEEKDRLAARLSRSPASWSFVRRAVPFMSSPAATDAIERRVGGA